MDKLYAQGSLRFRNWENFYFADHSDKLSEIRGKYDPTGGFDAPRYILGKTIQSDVDDPNEPQPVGNGNDDVDEVNDTQANDDCSSIRKYSPVNLSILQRLLFVSHFCE